MDHNAYTAALREELDGYRRAGREDRAAQVVAELKRLGVEVEAAVAEPAETAARPRRTRKANG